MGDDTSQQGSGLESGRVNPARIDGCRLNPYRWGSVLNAAGIPSGERQTFALRVDTTLDALGEVLTWFEAFRNAGIPDPIWTECQLALAEGFTNAVRHAHRALPESTPIDIGRNLIHGSDGVETAQREIALWFDESELVSWTPVAQSWIYE